MQLTSLEGTVDMVLSGAHHNVVVLIYFKFRRNNEYNNNDDYNNESSLSMYVFILMQNKTFIIFLMEEGTHEGKSA